MILKNPINKPRFQLWKYLLVVGILFVIGVLIISMKNAWNQWTQDDELITCSAEHLAKDETYFINKGYEFSGGDIQSSEYSRTGRFSIKLDAEHKYGLNYVLSSAQPGDQYRCSVWRLGNRSTQTYLVFSYEGDNPFYHKVGVPLQVEPSGWEELVINLEIPSTYKGEEIKIYVFNMGKEEVYFDDLRIEKLDRHNTFLNDSSGVWTPNQIQLEISDSDIVKLNEKRKKAIREYVLVSEESDWVKGRISQNENPIPIKLRLKGDHVDHLKEGKWSFRIKVKDPYAWNRMLTFSVHNSTARYHLHEWVYHQFMMREDVLTTRYDFAEVRLNEDRLGVYAYEEHFEKQLPEFQQRREGPILKFDEDGMWRSSKLAKRLDVTGINMGLELNTEASSEIQPFAENKTLENPLLKEQFELAHSLLNQFRFGDMPSSKVFDVDRLAKYYALVDINEAYHSIVWHNQRFYYNPVIGKLEPIGFDGFTELGAFNYKKRVLLGIEMKGLSGSFGRDIHIRHFQDPLFVAAYIRSLLKFTHPEYLDRFFLDLEPEIEARETFIRSEFPKYKFNPEYLKQRAQKIRALIYPIDHSSLRAYLQSTSGDSLSIAVANYHNLPLEIVGFGKKEEKMSMLSSDEKMLQPFNKAKPRAYTYISAPTQAKFIFFRVPGTDSLWKSRITPWNIDEKSIPVHELFADHTLVESDLYTITDSLITFKPGKYQVEKMLVFPKGYRVIFPAGTELNLIKGAGILSRSPLYMYGEESQPVVIRSSDKSGRGITVLQAETASELHYARFESLNTLVHDAWKLTGAVTFYESKVQINHCAFLDAQCEDALNLIRSSFSLRQSAISGAFSDGLDADFCKGEITHCRFSDTGNDGMDFSGSNIIIKDCEVISAGDKGVSGGEESFIEIYRLKVDGAVTGIAAKDFSELKIKSISLTDCTTGFAAYQKKPEYGRAIIVVDAFEAKDNKHLHLIEKGSELWLKGNKVSGI